MEKALIITPFYKPNIGGAETFAEDLSKVVSKKYETHISTIKWKKSIIWQGMNFRKALKLIWKLILPTKKLMDKYKYEKVYALGLISAFVCVLLRKKFSVVILALYDFTKENILYKFILNQADKVFVEGKRGKEDILKVGVREDKIVMFQHWVDQGRFLWKERKNQKIKILFIGRPIKIKGKHIIQECEKITKDVEYEYIENVPYEDLPKYYQMADICVVPSLYSEGFSRVVVEAASCGCMVIASNYGALPEMVDSFGTTIFPTAKNFSEEINFYKKNRYILLSRQLKTAWYAKENFSEKNADCFLL